jgi:hypothetical protein
MIGILPNILTLAQYLDYTFKTDPSASKPDQCTCGMSGLWCHGHYDRKLAHQEKELGFSEPIPIFRFFCKYCLKTCSVDPQCVSPHRWYLWAIQQAVVLELLAGHSVRAVSQASHVARSTCRRWWQRLQDQFFSHRDALRQELPQLGLHENFNDFWLVCLQKISLSDAMRICFQAGVSIP